VEKVDDQTLDVTAIVILIGHNHQVAVTQRLDVLLRVGCIKLETHDRHQVGDLLVLHNLKMGSITYIQWLTFERKHTVEITTDDRQPRHSQRLGRVSLGDDQSTVLRLCRSSVVGIVQLGNTCLVRRGMYERLLLVHNYDKHAQDTKLHSPVNLFFLVPPLRFSACPSLNFA
jgi:hypothetical protein